MGVESKQAIVRLQNTRPRIPLGHLWNSIQTWLFPVREDEIGALDEKHRQFVAVCELCAPQDHNMMNTAVGMSLCEARSSWLRTWPLACW